jgi:hypothetical protein
MIANWQVRIPTGRRGIKERAVRIEVARIIVTVGVEA